MRNQATHLLAALLAMVSIRILKSTPVIVNENISEALSLVGLAACFFVEPLLFLYIKASKSDVKRGNNGWLFHILPFALFFAFVGLSFSGDMSWWHSEWLRGTIYLQWFAYTLVSGISYFSVVQITTTKFNWVHTK